ncbi:replicative DNA helicase [Ruficoccus amylovorans]|uniref:DNA 5'-3' helicase n=1 Tax=Ruficoccus amylovorans TaxID=1804625 RepID=A0A842HF90_9BACT|nr:replicative DNA helicase [Ruficoccus amylovorans]MBC2594890.1 replicative DNA helicase [Ruficoccus amylovorans]
MTPTRKIPYSIEVEQALLGAVFVGGEEAMLECCEACVCSTWFYNTRHQLVFEAMLALIGKGEPIDEITVGDKLKSTGNFEAVGGDATLLELSNAVDTSSHLPYYIESLRKTWLRRQLIEQGNRLIESAYDATKEPEESLGTIQNAVYALGESKAENHLSDGHDLARMAGMQADVMLKRKGEPMGLCTGLDDFDKMVGGLLPKKTYIFAARPGMGKSAIGITIARNLVVPRRGSAIPAGYLSLEMGSEELSMRLACNLSRVDYNMLKEGDLSPTKRTDFNQALTAIDRAPIYIDDSSSLTPLQVRAKVRSMKHRYGIKVIFIDYLTLMEPTDKKASREQQVADMSRQMKAMSKELEIPVAVMCQLGRDAQGRRPKQSDLRESGSIEQDADVIAFIHRDEEAEESESMRFGKRTLIIEKQRNGPVGDIPLTFLKPMSLFENYAREDGPVQEECAF